MVEPCPFAREYFFQTRKEIQRQKRERDCALALAVLAMGAVACVLAFNRNFMGFLKGPRGFVVPLVSLVSVTGLFWWRYGRLRQIAERWYVLHDMIKEHLDAGPAARTLEAVVTGGFAQGKFLCTDLVLNFVFACPFYALLLLQARIYATWWWAFVLLILVHIAASFCLLRGSVENPVPPK